MNTRQKIQISCDPEKGKTQQHYKDECDINTIIRKYTETGLMPLNMAGPPNYGYATSQSFTEALQTVARATEEFMQLSSEVRAEFNNNPAEFLDALHNQEEQQRLVSLGILEGDANAAPELQKSENAPDQLVASTGNEAQPLPAANKGAPPIGGST